jgi:formamidopyrimidine-DNA glycosylase
MPELPEVETFKRLLDATCLGRTVAQVAVGDARILGGMSAPELAGRLKGARIDSSRRHGKHLLVGLGRKGCLALHFGMNGGLQHFTNPEEDPPYDRVRLDFADGHHLAYTNPRLLGRVELAADADAFVTAQGLGPDALDPRFDLADFKRALGGRKRDVKSVLMDQTVMAGIGNIYSDEILFQARIHPRTGTDQLDAEALNHLFREMRRVLETAIDCGAGAEESPERLPAGFLLRQRRKGGRCPRCGQEIATVKFGGRTSYYCPACQAEPCRP